MGETPVQPVPTSYPCRQCGRRDGLDAAVTDELWSELTGRTDGSGLLCLWCMDELATTKGIVGYVMLHFAGRALSGSGGPTIWDESELTEQLLEANDRCVRVVAENARLRGALHLGLPLVELYAKQLEPSIAAILAAWVVGARAALEHADG